MSPEMEIKSSDEKNITYIERNGKTFTIIEHFTGTLSYLDIVKNALRREMECMITHQVTCCCLERSSR